MRVLILAALLAATLWLIFRGYRRPAGTGKRVGGGKLVQDPVCKTYIPRDGAVVRDTGGETRYFCSEECARAYGRDPE